jgi:NAD(P)H-hydrate epimerase
MIPVLSVDLMRRSDAYTAAHSVPSRALMRRAGEEIFSAVRDRGGWRPPVAVLCGSGNNAGDGYVLALLLQEAGIPCTVFRLSDRLTEDGAYYAGLCREAGVPFRQWEDDTDLSPFMSVADCIFGIGCHGPIGDARIRSAIAAVNARREAGAFVVSADINSGLNADTGMACGGCAVRSDLTVSVGGYKPGHFLNMAKDLMKEKINCDIGISPIGEPYALFTEEDAKRAFPVRLHFSNKSTYGYVGLIGGSVRYSGAIRLASMANAAMRSGAGVVKVAVPASLCPWIAPAILEATLFPLPADENGSMVFDEAVTADLIRGLRAVAFGMGAGLNAETEKILRFLLERFDGMLILDADALNALARTENGLPLLDAAAERGCRIILTPHTMEFARLLGLARETGVSEVLADPVGLAKSFAAAHGVTLLLKGPATVVTDGKTVLFVDRGCPGMATAGSGDVLSGILAALCGFHSDPLLAAAAGAWINGRAGELAQEDVGPVSMTAGDTVSKIPAAIRSVSGSGTPA